MIPDLRWYVRALQVAVASCVLGLLGMLAALVLVVVGIWTDDTRWSLTGGVVAAPACMLFLLAVASTGPLGDEVKRLRGDL